MIFLILMFVGIFLGIRILTVIVQASANGASAIKTKRENDALYVEALRNWEIAVKRYNVDTSTPVVYEKYNNADLFHPIHVWRGEDNTLVRFRAKPSKEDFINMKDSFLFIENLKPDTRLSKVDAIHRTMRDGLKLTTVNWGEGYSINYKVYDYDKLLSLFPEFK